MIDARDTDQYEAYLGQGLIPNWRTLGMVDRMERGITRQRKFLLHALDMHNQCILVNNQHRAESGSPRVNSSGVPQPRGRGSSRSRGRGRGKSTTSSRSSSGNRSPIRRQNSQTSYVMFYIYLCYT